MGSALIGNATGGNQGAYYNPHQGKAPERRELPQANIYENGNYGGVGYTPVPQTWTAQGKPAWMTGVWDMPQWGYSAANPTQALTQADLQPQAYQAPQQQQQQQQAPQQQQQQYNPFEGMRPDQLHQMYAQERRNSIFDRSDAIRATAGLPPSSRPDIYGYTPNWMVGRQDARNRMRGMNTQTLMQRIAEARKK